MSGVDSNPLPDVSIWSFCLCCRHTLDAMRIVGLSQHAIDSVLRLVACVLHLGNIEFVNNAADEATIVDADSMHAMEAAAALLGVSPALP